jgi:hypothetical protein
MGGKVSKSDVDSMVDAKLKNHIVRKDLTNLISNEDLDGQISRQLSTKFIHPNDFESQIKSQSLWCSSDGTICRVPIGFAHIWVSTPPNMMTDVHVDSEGTYTASASSTFTDSTQASDAFNDTNTPWQTASHYTNGSYTGSESTIVDGTPYAGEWLQIQLPHNLLVSTFVVWTGSSTLSPRSFILAGSTDGYNWSKLHQATNLLNWSVALPWSTTVATRKPFSYFRLIILQVTSGSTASIRRLSFRGLKQ